ncbi:MAG TPA: acyltransferase [Rudaea sp.]
MIRGRVFGLDLLRALAVLLVLVGHATFMFLPVTHTLDAWWVFGQFGVELFFVLSGFLIGAILADQAAADDLPLGRFWARRWLRTLPNYYLFLLINVLLERWVDGVWPQAWSYLIFSQNLAWPQAMFFSESWSLAVEEIFYLVAPLLVLAALRTRLRRVDPVWLIVAAIAAFTLVRIVYVAQLDPPWDSGVRKVTLVRLDAIAYGALALVLYRRGGVVVRRAGTIALAGLCAVSIAGACYLLLPRDTSYFARTLLFNLLSLGFAALLPFAAEWKRSGCPAIVENAIRKIALWSYALYLCQLAVMRVLVSILGWNGQSAAMCLLQAIAYCLLAIACAALVYYAFESPLLRLRDRWTTRRLPAARVEHLEGAHAVAAAHEAAVAASES